MLLFDSSILVQGRVVDAKTSPRKFDETVADAGKQKKKTFLKGQPKFCNGAEIDLVFKGATSRGFRRFLV